MKYIRRFRTATSPVPHGRRGADIRIGTVRIGKARDLSRACSLRERTSDSEPRRSHETLVARSYVRSPEEATRDEKLK